MNDNIQKLLEQVSQIIKNHKEHANKQGENFNIFSILRMERREVKTHSNFIYELLNPKGRHGQGDIFLKSFAKIVIKSEVPDTVENPQQEDLTDENRRIDFTLETDKNIIGIEMKIDAGDQENQLYDYYEELEKRANNKGKEQGIKLFYLTLFGDESSEYSHTKDGKKVEYKCISFSDGILSWINECIKQSAEKSVLREALIQYKILIEKLTGKNNDMNMEIAELLIKDTEKLKTAIELKKALPQAKASFEKSFWTDLMELLVEMSKDKFEGKFSFSHEWEVIENTKMSDICLGYYKGENNTKYHGIIYDEKIILIVDHNIYFVLKNGEFNIDNKYKKGVWGKVAIWFYAKTTEKNLNFRKFNNDLIDMLSGEARQNTIKGLADEFIKLIETIEKSEKK